MNNGKDDQCLDTAIEAELQRLEQSVPRPRDSDTDRLLAELQSSIKAEVAEGSDNIRQPGILELALDTVDRVHGLMVHLSSQPAGTPLAHNKKLHPKSEIEPLLPIAPTRSKPGPKRDLETAQRVRKIVTEIAPSGPWKRKLGEVCEKLDQEQISIPKKWRKRHVSDWRDAAAVERDLAIKAIEYRLQNTRN